MVKDWSSFLVESGKRKFFFTFRQVPHLNLMMTVQLTVPTAKQVGARFLQTPCNHNMYTFVTQTIFNWNNVGMIVLHLSMSSRGGGGGVGRQGFDPSLLAGVGHFNYLSVPG